MQQKVVKNEKPANLHEKTENIIQKRNEEIKKNARAPTQADEKFSRLAMQKETRLATGGLTDRDVDFGLKNQ